MRINAENEGGENKDLFGLNLAASGTIKYSN